MKSYASSQGRAGRERDLDRLQFSTMPAGKLLTEPHLKKFNKINDKQTKKLQLKGEFQIAFSPSFRWKKHYCDNIITNEDKYYEGF